MRVVVATGIFPPDIGGPATHASHLGAELRRRGHEVLVLTLTDEDRTVFEPGMVRHPRKWPWPLRTATGVWWLLRARRRYDIVYATGLDLPAVVGACLARRPVVLKVVADPSWERATRQGLTASTFAEFQTESGGSVRLRAMRALRNWTVRSASAVVTPSEYLHDVISGWTRGRRDVAVVPNGAIPNPYRAGRIAEPGRLQLIFVGRLVGHKRVDVLVEAVAASPGCALDIVGDGPERLSLEALVRRLELGDRVRFTGPVTPDDAMRRMAEADVLVNASTYEGLPHVAVEALVSGLPIVCSPAGGTVEVVEDGHNGLIVEEPGPSTFASAFSRLRDEPALLARLAEGALETSTAWRFDRAADRIETLLENVIEARPVPSTRSPRDTRPAAVFVGRGVPLPPSVELRQKFAIHARLLRQLSVTTGRPGLWRISGVRVLAFPRIQPPLLGGLLFYTSAPVVAVAAALRRRAAIVCQSPYEAFGTILISRVLPRRVRPLVQVELHGDWRTASRLYGSPARSVLGPACDRACRWALQRADRVRTVSQVLTDQARDAGYTGPVDRYFTFSDFGAFLDIPAEPPPDEPVALFIGVLERYKAVDVLLEAWPGVVDAVPGAELVLVGDGTLGPQMRRRIDAGEVPHARIHAPVSQPELARLLDGCTCLVLPSRSEGLPRVVMEAMARGRPVVASDVGGMRELVIEGETGRVVPVGDPGALAKALAETLGDREAAERMGREARRRAEERDPGTEYEAGMARLAAWIRDAAVT